MRLYTDVLYSKLQQTLTAFLVEASILTHVDLSQMPWLNLPNLFTHNDGHESHTRSS